MEQNNADAVRIQTSVLNALEKKVLIWLAQRQPRWVTSDMLTYIGVFGAVVIAAGYILASRNINFLWLSSLGFIINTLFATISPLREFSHSFVMFGSEFTFKALDYIGVVIVLILALMHLTTVRTDIKGYAEIDPIPQND